MIILILISLFLYMIRTQNHARRFLAYLAIQAIIGLLIAAYLTSEK